MAAVRTGLGQERRSGIPRAPKTEPHSFGFRPGIDLDKLNQLADDLEPEAFAEKLRRRRK